MSDAIRLSAVTLNAPDAIALAEFYAVITGGLAQGDTTWALVTGPGGTIEFQQIENFRPPDWPDGPVPMQMHLDFLVDDLVATELRVLAAGAVRSPFQPNVNHCLVFTDPAGHPFCLSKWDGAQALAQLRVEATALVADPDDREESAQVLRDVELLRAW